MKGLSGKEIRLIMIYRYNRYARLYSFIKNSTAPRPASKINICHYQRYAHIPAHEGMMPVQQLDTAACTSSTPYLTAAEVLFCEVERTTKVSHHTVRTRSAITQCGQ